MRFVASCNHLTLALLYQHKRRFVFSANALWRDVQFKRTLVITHPTKKSCVFWCHFGGMNLNVLTRDQDMMWWFHPISAPCHACKTVDTLICDITPRMNYQRPKAERTVGRWFTDEKLRAETDIAELTPCCRSISLCPSDHWFFRDVITSNRLRKS